MYAGCILHVRLRTDDGYQQMFGCLYMCQEPSSDVFAGMLR